VKKLEPTSHAPARSTPTRRPSASRAPARRTPTPGRLFALGAILALAAVAAGCAGSGGRFVEEPGVPVTVLAADGAEISGRLIAYENGAFIVEHAIPKNEDVMVVMKEGEKIVYVRNVPIGVAAEIRDFDVVVRERVPVESVGDAEVTTRALFGWGTALAALLSFGLIELLQEL